MGIPLSRVLHDFGRAGASPEAPSSAPATVAHCEPVEDLVAARVAEAYARGEEAGRAAACAEHEEALAALRAEAEAELAGERQRWAAEQGDVLAARLSAAIEALEGRIADPVARVLGPFLAAELRTRMVKSLAESVGTLAASGRCARLHISGPEDLIGALREKLEGSAVAIDWEPNGQPEVRLVSDDSVIETDVQGWIDLFAGGTR